MSDRQSEPLVADLKPAFEWECAKCGALNFARAVVVAEPDFSSTGEFPKGEWLDAQFVAAPAQVSCKECFADYPTEEPPHP